MSEVAPPVATHATARPTASDCSSPASSASSPPEAPPTPFKLKIANNIPRLDERLATARNGRVAARASSRRSARTSSRRCPTAPGSGHAARLAAAACAIQPGPPASASARAPRRSPTSRQRWSARKKGTASSGATKNNTLTCFTTTADAATATAICAARNKSGAPLLRRVRVERYEQPHGENWSAGRGPRIRGSSG